MKLRKLLIILPFVGFVCLAGDCWAKDEGQSSVELVIAGSDSYDKYKDHFLEVTKKLVASKKCTLEHFKKADGWRQSVQYKPKKVFFVYCGKIDKENRIYFDIDKNATY